MHNKNLDILRNEALRLIAMEEQALKSIAGVPGLLAEGGQEEKASFNQERIREETQVLTGERHKLKSMEMVIAVVGTMKAGKSTTINAIVGTEVLPNRNGPMTAIPTLIRHTPGQKEPLALFKNNRPVNELLGTLREKLIRDPELADQVATSSTDMADLVRFVRGGSEVDTRYEGRDGIFRLLRMLNDLVRLCSDLDVPFPFEDYDEMHELPEIEVAFATLSEQESSLGRITLLDTPGPNEAGQAHLKVMLRDQLRKASAVLAVLNYTNLRSESDHDFRAEVQAIAEVAKGRMYALVNKYDQRSRNDPDEQEIRNTVSQQLLHGDIPEEFVFAVSAQLGFLSELVRNHLEQNGVLPDWRRNGWVAEFGESCFGMDWEDDIADTDAVRKAAVKLWRKSGFEQPIERVIRTAHQNAALFALEASAAKLVNLSERISNFVEGRAVSLRKTSEELQRYITELKSDVEIVSELRRSKEKEISETLEGLANGFQKCVEGAKDIMSELAEALFEQQAESDSKVLERANDSSLTMEERSRFAEQVAGSIMLGSSRGMLAALLGAPKRAPSKPRGKFFDGKNKLDFASEEKARDFLIALQKEFSIQVEDLSAEVSKLIQKAVFDLDKTIKDSIVADSTKVLSDISERLGQHGFDLSFKLPDGLQVAVSTVCSDAMVESFSHSKKSVTRTREQDGVLGKGKRIFGTILRKSDWGYEEYQKEISVYCVTRSKLEKNISKLVDEQFNSWRQEITLTVEKPVHDSVSEFFDALIQKVEAVREDLLEGIRDKQKSREEQDELFSALTDIADSISGMKEDSISLSDDARELKMVKV